MSGTPSLCLVAPGMIIVPGVPLINGVQDMIRNHMTLGISRLGFAFLVTTAIALGLFVATVATGVTIPVAEPARAIAIPLDALFSALAALGYAFLFNVPARMAWACVVCGVASHTTRTLGIHLGIDLIAGTLVGALIAGLLAQGFARYFDAPAAAFAFPGVVAMVPGAYAFRAVLGCLEIAHGTATPPLPAETLALSITVALMVAAIAVGIAAPALLFSPPTRRATGNFPASQGLSRDVAGHGLIREAHDQGQRHVEPRHVRCPEFGRSLDRSARDGRLPACRPSPEIGPAARFPARPRS